MGCAPSTIGEESVSGCKERRLLMKQAIVARTAFAAAHTAYAAALMSTGFAFGRYAHCDAAAKLPASKRDASKLDCVSIPKDDDALEESVKAKVKPSVSIFEDDVVLEELFKATGTKQKRGVSNKDSVSNDDVSEESAKALPVPGWDYFSVNLREPVITDSDEELEFLTPDNLSKIEVSDEDEEEEEETPLQKQFMHAKTVSDEIKRASNANWLKSLKEISDQFIKASECVQEVSKLLEPNRYRFHSNAADNRDIVLMLSELSSAATVDHTARVMRVITWNQPNDAVNKHDDFKTIEKEPLSAVLDKLLAWEKKLYDEVKAGELTKQEYQRKLVLLAKQKRRGASIELLVKTKAAVRHLHTRYIVDMQLIDSTVSEINNLRDFQLYPKLVELVEGMANMWKNMSTHHNNQMRIATDLKSHEISAVDGETTWDHYKQTTKLLSVVEAWQIQFNNLIVHQKCYINALNIWFKLNLIPIRNNLKEKLSSSSKRIPNPPIQLLLYTWHEYIEKLPYKTVNTAITSFAATIETINLVQEKEMKLKEKCEETRKDYLRKNQAFEEWLHKHNERSSSNMVSAERRVVIDSLKKRLDEEMEDHRNLCLRVRAKSFWNLSTRLPELLRAMLDYAHSCVDTYNRLIIMCNDLSEDATNVKSDPS